ncbi:MAG: DUF2191 domain-containing protein [Ignavibacteria bacterium]
MKKKHSRAVEENSPIPLIFTILYRILYRMKVTAIVPDSLINEIKQYSGGKNITESITIALKEWRDLKRVKRLNKLVEKKPLTLDSKISYRKIRGINRKG